MILSEYRMKVLAAVKYYPFELGEDALYDGTSYSIVQVLNPLWYNDGSSTSMPLLYDGACLALWLKKNTKGLVFHEFNNGLPVLTNDRHPHDKKCNNNNRFYFSIKKEADKFREYLETIEFSHNDTRLLPSTNNEAFEHFEIKPLGGMIQLKEFDNLCNKYCMDIWFWCLDNLKGQVYYNMPGILIFEEQSDATLFKLHFFDNIKTI